MGNLDLPVSEYMLLEPRNKLGSGTQNTNVEA